MQIIPEQSNMSYNPNIHHRRSIRLKGYNYSSSGIYFLTICTQSMNCLFGNAANGKMFLNDAGIAAQSCWVQIPLHFPFVSLDEFVIMPNHVHGIIEIKDSDDSEQVGVNFCNIVGANECDCVGANKCDCVGANNHSPLRGTSKSIGSIVRGYKIGVTKWFRKNTDIYPVWQRDYYDHVIRNELELRRIRDYIISNPVNWRRYRN
jgi:REP element-mobilizing transposase RayT